MGGYICLGFMILSITPQSFWSYNQISYYVGKESFKDFWWWWWWWWWWTVFVVWLTDERRSLISSRDHCQRSSPSRISDMPRSGSEPVQNLSSGFDEWSCAVVITTTPRLTSLYILFCCLVWSLYDVAKMLGEILFSKIIVIRNGKMVWKIGRSRGF